jgi:hypothetical protein
MNIPSFQGDIRAGKLDQNGSHHWMLMSRKCKPEKLLLSGQPLSRTTMRELMSRPARRSYATRTFHALTAGLSGFRYAMAVAGVAALRLCRCRTTVGHVLLWARGSTSSSRAGVARLAHPEILYSQYSLSLRCDRMRWSTAFAVIKLIGAALRRLA